MTKLNFITDHGSNRDSCRCALRGDLAPADSPLVPLAIAALARPASRSLGLAPIEEVDGEVVEDDEAPAPLPFSLRSWDMPVDPARSTDTEPPDSAVRLWLASPDVSLTALSSEELPEVAHVPLEYESVSREEVSLEDDESLE
jgi:hypothetical protein